MHSVGKVLRLPFSLMKHASYCLLVLRSQPLACNKDELSFAAKGCHQKLVTVVATYSSCQVLVAEAVVNACTAALTTVRKKLCKNKTSQYCISRRSRLLYSFIIAENRRSLVSDRLACQAACMSVQVLAFLNLIFTACQGC